jgi:hypothetical protein
MTHNTLRKSLNKNSAQADADGLYSTKQVIDAVFGGLADEKLATQRQLTSGVAVQNPQQILAIDCRVAIQSSAAAFWGDQ